MVLISKLICDNCKQEIKERTFVQLSMIEYHVNDTERIKTQSELSERFHLCKKCAIDNIKILKDD